MSIQGTWSESPAPDWRRRFRAVEQDLPRWAARAPERLLLASTRAGRWDLWAVDLASGRGRRVTTGPGRTPRGAIDPTGRCVWVFADDRGSEWGRWRVVSFAAGGRPPRAFAGATALPAGHPAGLALARGVAAVGIAGRADTAVFLVERARAPRLLWRGTELVRVASITPGGDLVCIEHGSVEHHRDRALTVLDRAGRPVARLPGGRGRGLRAVAWSPAPAPRAGEPRLLVTHEQSGFPRPAVWTPHTGELRTIGPDGPGEAEARWSADGRHVLVLQHWRAQQRLWRADPAGGAPVELPLPRCCGGAIVHDAALRPDGEPWLLCSSPSMPPTVFGARGPVPAAAAPAAGAAAEPPAPAIPRGVPGTHHEVAGIHLLLTRPPGRGPWPTVFELHGGPAREHRDGWQPEVQTWVDHGLAVVRPNPRGSSGSGSRWRDANLGDPGFPALEDLARVRAWALAQGIADPRRLALAGHSWGGYLALLGLGRQPDHWTACIARMPIADPAALLEDAVRPIRAMDRALFGGTPAQRPGPYRERSPLTWATAVRAPVLLLAGENDPRCPPAQIERYARRLEHLGVPHEVVRFDAGHGPLSVATRMALVERELAFLQRHLPGMAR